MDKTINKILLIKFIFCSKLMVFFLKNIHIWKIVKNGQWQLKISWLYFYFLFKISLNNYFYDTWYFYFFCSCVAMNFKKKVMHLKSILMLFVL